MVKRNVLGLSLVIALCPATPPRVCAAGGDAKVPACVGETTPLPLEVKTPDDLAFKALAERHYLIVNLLTAGRAAAQRRDFATAVARWDALLKIDGVPIDVQREVTPLLAEARARAKEAGVEVPAATIEPPERSTRNDDDEPRVAAHRASSTLVTGSVSGGGARGPGGTVVWLKRLDKPMPAPAPVVRAIHQRNKTFFPHVLVVPVGGKVAFVNDDEIHHNVFSGTQPNDFDSGLYRKGGAFEQTFKTPGPVEILCNIHATMQAYVYVVDSPYYAVAAPSGHFKIANVPPGRYRLEAWHESSTRTSSQIVNVGPAGAAPVLVAVAGDKAPRGPAPDKYGRPRQEHIGY